MDEKFGIMRKKCGTNLEYERKGEALGSKRDMIDKASPDGWEHRMWKTFKDDSRRRWGYGNDTFINKVHM